MDSFNSSCPVVLSLTLAVLAKMSLFAAWRFFSEPAERKGQGWSLIGFSLLCFLFEALALLWILQMMHAETALHGALAGLCIGFGIVATTWIQVSLFHVRPLLLDAKEMAYFLGGTVVMATILGALA